MPIGILCSLRSGGGINVAGEVPEIACLRIGAFRDKPTDRRLLYVWLSPRDTVHLVQRCIDAPDYHFIVVYGIIFSAGIYFINRLIAKGLDTAPADEPAVSLGGALAAAGKRTER